MEDFRASQERQSEGFFPTTPSKNRHVSGKSAVLKASLHRIHKFSEAPRQRLYTRYGKPLLPGALFYLAFQITSLCSFLRGLGGAGGADPMVGYVRSLD